MDKYDIVIIGAGPAGLTAAMYAARANKTVAVIEKLAVGGQLALTPKVENFPGSSSARGWKIAERMKAQALEAGAKLISGDVTAADLEARIVTLSDKALEAGAIIIATGAKSGKLGLKGEDELKGAGISYCAVCDGAFFRGKDVALAGGGERSKADLAYLAGVCRKVSYISSGEVGDIEGRDNIEVFDRTRIVELIGNPLEAVVTERAGERRRLDVSGLFVDTALRPETRFASGLDTDKNGFIVTDEEMRTNIPRVYAAGDVRSKTLRQVVTAAGDGATAATTAVKELKKSEKK